MRKPETGQPPKRRLARDDWARAALGALREGGLGAVVVETLAARLGTTKGSFYWHFRDREELVGAALQLWEQHETLDLIEFLETIESPRLRLQRLFEVAFGDEAGGLVHVALLADAANPMVGSVLRRVTRRRVDFLAACFAELGLAEPEARHQALVAYTAYVGYFQLRRAAPAETPSGPEAADYLEHLLRVLDPRAPTGPEPVAGVAERGHP